MAASKPAETKMKYAHPDQPPGRFTATLLLPASSPAPGPGQDTPRKQRHPWKEAGKERKRRKRKERGRVDY